MELDRHRLDQAQVIHKLENHLHCFIVLISVTGAITFSIVENISKYYRKSEKHSLSLHLVEMNTDPDPAK